MFLHRLFCFLRLRDPLDYAPPALGPEVPHPYEQHETLVCCNHCGGGKRHQIHQPPYDENRLREIAALHQNVPVWKMPPMPGHSPHTFISSTKGPLCQVCLGGARHEIHMPVPESKRIVDWRPPHDTLNLVMRCYELADGTLVRIDTLEPWVPPDGYTFDGEVPYEFAPVRGRK